MRLPVLALALGLLPGCGSVGDLVGAATGTAAAAGSANPALGVAVGVGARAVVGWGIRRTARRWRRTEQEAIAAAAGGAPVGEARRWEARHTLAIGDARGRVRVLREVATPLAACREVAFSVERGRGAAAREAWFVTGVCRGESGGWRWAAAEPATGRWGSLR